MNRHTKDKSKGKGKGKILTISGPWKTKFSMPVGRLPISIGSDRSLSSSDSVYPRKVTLSVPITPTIVGVVTGNIATSAQISTAIIPSFATRFGTLFDEYCIVGAKLELRLQAPSAGATGYVIAAIDEKSVAVGTINLLDGPHLEILMSATESPSRYAISWVAKDFLDLQWTAVGTAVTPVTIRFFGSAATGIGAANGANLLITGTLCFDFRGYTQG